MVLFALHLVESRYSPSALLLQLEGTTMSKIAAEYNHATREWPDDSLEVFESGGRIIAYYIPPGGPFRIDTVIFFEDGVVDLRKVCLGSCTTCKPEYHELRLLDDSYEFVASKLARDGDTLSYVVGSSTSISYRRVRRYKITRGSKGEITKIILS